MQKITEPGAAFSATCIAAAKVAPPEMPVKMPSLLASFRDQSIATGPAIAIS
jgi:hypothetical protein